MRNTIVRVLVTLSLFGVVVPLAAVACGDPAPPGNTQQDDDDDRNDD